MKCILYIRRVKGRPGTVTMDTNLESEPCYDTPRVCNLALEIRERLDEIIDGCVKEGAVYWGKYHTRASEIEKPSTKL